MTQSQAPTGQRPPALRATRTGGSAPLVRLDELDLAALRLLNGDADLTNRSLAQRLGISESTCAYRLRALRAAGVVIGTRIDLDLALLGRPLQAVIKVRLGSHSQELVTELYDALASAPGVLRAFHMAGTDDFHLHVAVADATALRDLVLQHVTVHKVVRQTETQLVFEVREGTGVLDGVQPSVPSTPAPTHSRA